MMGLGTRCFSILNTFDNKAYILRSETAIFPLYLEANVSVKAYPISQEPCYYFKFKYWIYGIQNEWYIRTCSF